MINSAILCLSILLQLSAAFFSLRLRKETGSRYPWLPLAVALVLMAFTQIITLGEVLMGDAVAQANTLVGIVVLLISLLMITGILKTGPIFLGARNADRQTRAEKARAAIYLDSAPGIVLALDNAGTVILVNRGGCALLGYDKDEILGRNWFTDFLPEGDQASGFERFRQSVSGEQDLSDYFENVILAKGGGHVSVRWVSTFVRDSEGDSITGLLSTGTDISEQQELADKLAESEKRLGIVANSAAVGIIVINDDGIVTQMNPCSEKMFGYDSSAVIGNNVSMLMPEADRSRHDNYIQSYLRTGIPKIINIGRDISGIRKNGEEFSLHLKVSEIIGSQQKSFVGIVSDITVRKRVEERLRHSQKMETVGQLTGGVAHDFNNLLAVVLGNLSLLDEELEEYGVMSPAQMQEFIQPAIAAGKRGAELTQRLLAFSRKQPLQPVALDINVVVMGMEDMLVRTLGEDIEIDWQLADTTWLAEADKSQLDNVILNLAVNARDAMPSGGRLTIETSEVTLHSDFGGSHGEIPEGEYLLMLVRDTGSGIAKEVMKKVFEPFFTTKDVGKGTGLGLSMVYGFAKQSGGQVSIYSEPGEGTTIKLYLPRTDTANVAGAAVQQEDQTRRAQGGDETILLVEDDPAVRRIVTRMLDRLGYLVLEAEDGATALAVLEENSVDLLLTDVVLPGGMSGPDIARQALQQVPGLPVLYMSGYTENAILHHGRLDEGINLISKPFSNAALEKCVRDVLESCPGSL